MTEAMIVEAVRAAGVNSSAAAGNPQAAAAPDPNAVQAFQRAMAPEEASPVPFTQQVSEVWASAQNDYQTSLHRMEKLTEMSRLGGISAAQLTELQYEVANLSFQQEIVTNIAKKASDAVSTLIKNS